MKAKIVSYFNKLKGLDFIKSNQTLKVGSIVARKSYNKDIIFIIDKIIGGKGNSQIAILKGLTVRIVADSPLSDLVIMDKFSRK